jgi:signal transduction histidine kinase
MAPLLAGSFVVLCTAFMFSLSNSTSLPVDERGLETEDFAWVAAAIVSAVTGALIVVRKHRHLVGWSLLGYGLIGSTGFAIYGLSIYAMDYGLETAAATLEGVAAGMISAGFIFIPSAIFLFPTGSLPSRRWRPLAWVMVTAVGVGFFVGLVNLGFGGDTSDVLFGPGPLEDALGGLATALSGPYFLLLFVSGVGAIASLVLRYRGAIGEERLQLKWVVAASLFFAATLALTAAVAGLATVSDSGPAILLGLGLASIPAAMGVAILKYRLFDIDVVISRSLTYGVLAVFIGVVYVAIVVGIGELFTDGEGASVGLSIVATALVAIAFQPVRRRVEHWANRLVYGDRATPYEVLARFSQRVSEMSDEDLLERIPRLIVDGTRASGSALWVRSGTGFHTAAAWPETDTNRTIEASDRFTDPDADYSLPVLHDGELLGGVSLVNERGETITPAEEELLANLANAMGLALRNTQLTAQLRRQVKDLKRSRDRVMSAADEARRSLEHDLDSGPQQQLVAVKVKLGPTRMLAERAGANKTAKILADIEQQAGDAIAAIREFAAGIYPPLLGAEGLAVALAQQTSRAALPVTLDAETIGRYPRDVEAAVYFTVLEALQNTAKYAQATTAKVSLNEHNGNLQFAISDNGIGFHTAQTSKGAGLNGITDRLDTIGGTWHIQSTPGTGTTITATVPVKDSAPV